MRLPQASPRRTRLRRMSDRPAPQSVPAAGPAASAAPAPPPRRRAACPPR